MDEALPDENSAEQGRQRPERASRKFCAVRLSLGLGVVLLLTACRPKAPPAVALSKEPTAWVPAPTRALLSLDLAALRRAPVVARWLRERAGSDCAARLSERVQHLAVLSPEADPGAFAVVLAGDLPGREVAACARATDATAVIRPLRYRGTEVLRIAVPTRDGRAVSDAEVDLLPHGVAIIGPALLARAALDAGISLAQGESERHVLAPLWEALPGDAPVRFAARLATPTLPLEAVSGWARLDDRVRLGLRGFAADEERAVGLGHRAIAWRDETRATLTHPGLRDLVGALRVRTEGRAVQVEATLDAARLEAVAAALRILGSGLSASPTTP